MFALPDPDAPAPTRPDRPVLRVRSTAELLALVPVTLGFEPAESLVVVATAGSQPGFQTRVDLPEPRAAGAVADQVVDAVVHQGCTRVAVIAFSARPRTAEQVVLAVGERVRASGVEVLDLLRTDGSRYWSLLCTDPRCCPSIGTPYDPLATTLRAEAVLAGRTVAPDRAALAARYAAVSGAAVGPARAALRAAEADAVAVLGLRGTRQLRRPSIRAVSAAAPLGAVRVDALLDALLAAAGPGGPGWSGGPERVAAAVTDEHAATLSVWCSLQPVRDLAWARMTRADAARHLALWTTVSQRVLPPYERAVLGLTAFAAWLSGDGASAWCVLDRCAEVDRRYPMAALVADALHRCVSPDAWKPFPRALTLEACGLPAADGGWSPRGSRRV